MCYTTKQIQSNPFGRGYSSINAVTDAQQKYINSIEDYSNYKFDGRTKEEASEFISKYKHYCILHPIE